MILKTCRRYPNIFRLEEGQISFAELNPDYESVKTVCSQSSDSGVELDKNKDSDSIITVME